MKNKQIAGIVIAGIVFIAVGVMGVASNYFAGKFNQSATESFGSLWEEYEDGASISLPENQFIGVINVVGTIQGSQGSGLSSGSGYNHSLYMKFVDKMMESDNNRGIMLYVDSPGGNVYESDELYLKLMEYKEATGRPVWAYFASEACSGGYYISMAADKINANRNCWTGSIGVIISLTNYKDLYDKVGLKEIDITSGANKAMGSGAAELTEEQRQILQDMVDEAYDQFVGIVAEGRNMDEAQVRKLADGRIYTAKQAIENGLVDELGSYEDMQEQFETAVGETGLEFYAPEADSLTSLFSSLFSAYQAGKSRSDAEVVEDAIENSRNGVLMYYAK